MSWCSRSSLLGEGLTLLPPLFPPVQAYPLVCMAFDALQTFHWADVTFCVSEYICFSCWIVFCHWSHLKWLTEESGEHISGGRWATGTGSQKEGLRPPCLAIAVRLAHQVFWNRAVPCLQDAWVRDFNITFVMTIIRQGVLYMTNWLWIFLLFLWGHVTLRNSRILSVCFLKGISQREV